MDIKDIKAQLSITEVLNHYGLKPDKNDRLLCPFHPDTNPSPQVYPKTNTFCCFSSNCTAGTGDSIQFIQLKENCNKHEALTKAQSLLPPPSGVSAVAEGGANTNTTVLAVKVSPNGGDLEGAAILTKAFKIFAKALPLTKKATEYLQGRGLDYKLHEVGAINNNLRSGVCPLRSYEAAPVRVARTGMPHLVQACKK